MGGNDTVNPMLVFFEPGEVGQDQVDAAQEYAAEEEADDGQDPRAAGEFDGRREQGPVAGNEE